MKKAGIIACGLLGLTLMLSGCNGLSASQTTTTAAGSTTATTTAASTAASSDTVKVGMSFHSMMNDVFVSSEEYLKQFGSEATPKVEFSVVVADNDVSKQAADVKDLISKKPDVIAIVPEDSRAVESSIKEAHAAGIPVVVYNRPVNEDVAEQPDCFVGIDSTDQGYASAKYVFEKMKTAGIDKINVIAISGALTDENSVNRSNGLAAAAKEYGATIVQDIPCDWDPEKAAANLPAALKAAPQTNCIFVSSDCMMAGVQSSLEDVDKWAPTGEENHMYIASCDVFAEGLDLLESKYIDADALFDIVTQSKETVRVINDLAAGKEVEPKILVKGPVFTQDNYNNDDMKALLW